MPRSSRCQLCRSVAAEIGTRRSERGYDFSHLCRHCDVETSVPVECHITGTIPPWIYGRFVYNGPGLTRVGKTEFKHFFDSAALLQKVEISANGAQYSNKFLRSNTYAQNLAAGTITIQEFATAVTKPKSFFSRLKSIVDPIKHLSDNALMSIVEVSGRYYALCDKPFMLEIDLNTLETTNWLNMYKQLGLIMMSPHPIQASDGSCYTVGHTVGLMGPRYSILRFPPKGTSEPPEIVASLGSRWCLTPCYIHSIALTPNYLILFEMPLAVSLPEIMSDMLNSTPLIDSMKWREEQTLVHVFDRRTWKEVMTRYLLPPFFILHFANSYEENGSIVLDFLSYPDASVIYSMYIKNLREQRGSNSREFAHHFDATPTRVVIPVEKEGNKTEIVLETHCLTDVSFENPCINPMYKGCRHRYIYGMGPCPEGRDRGHVTKLDVMTGSVTQFMEEQLYTGEPIFIPNPQGKSEDDGVIVAVCIHSDNNYQGSLVILDAVTLQEVGRITYTAQAAVPIPIHGTFVPAAP